MAKPKVWTASRGQNLGLDFDLEAGRNLSLNWSRGLLFGLGIRPGSRRRECFYLGFGLSLEGLVLFRISRANTAEPKCVQLAEDVKSDEVRAMRPIAPDAVAWSACLSVCSCVSDTAAKAPVKQPNRIVHNLPRTSGRSQSCPWIHFV